MLAAEPSFKNLSQLIKDKEKQKMQVKSSQIANDILKRFSHHRKQKLQRGQLRTKHSVETFPTGRDSHIISLNLRDTSEDDAGGDGRTERELTPNNE